MKRTAVLVVFVACHAVLSAVAFAEVEVTLLEQTFTRIHGKPGYFMVGFPGVPGTGTLHIANGDTVGTDRVSAAIMKVNGVDVFRAQDFNPRVGELQVEVQIGEQNTLEIELRSKVGSYLNLRIDQTLDVAGAAVVGPDGGVVRVGDSSSSIDGVTVTFPPDSLSRPIAVTIKSAPEISVPFNAEIQEGYSFPAFKLEPENVRINGLVEIRIPYPDSDRDGILDELGIPVQAGSVFFMRDGDAEMFRADTDVDEDSGEYVVTTDHFSYWIPFIGRWIKGSTVRYWIESVPDYYYSFSSFRREIEDAFDQWSEAIDNEVTFIEGLAWNSDIYIRERDFCSFWFTFGTECYAAGVASRPYQAGGTPDVEWTVSFNRNYLWISEDYNPYPPTHLPPPGSVGDFGYLPFLRLALHEFGHVMGLPDFSGINRYSDADPYVMRYDSGETLPLELLGSLDRTRVRDLYNLDNGNGSSATSILVPNGSFESGLDSWVRTFPAVNPEYWSSASGDFQVVTGISHDGNHSLRLGCGQPGDNWVASNLIPVSVTSSGTLEWEVWFRPSKAVEARTIRIGSDVDDHPDIGLFTYSATGGWAGGAFPSYVPATAAGEWNSISGTTVIDPDVKFVRLILGRYNGGLWDCSTTYWFDDVSLFIR